MKLEVTQILQDRIKQETTVYLKGCPLRCPWCNRPEARKPKKELLYDLDGCVECMQCFPDCPVDAHELVNSLHLVDRYKCIGCMECVDLCPAGVLLPASRSMGIPAILGQCQKTLILSGGEPLVHHEAVLELLEKAKEKGLLTVIETTGAFYPSQIPALLPLTDLFVFRIMDTDPLRMKKNTGAKLDVLLNNLKAVDAAGGKTRLLCKLIPGINTDDAHAEGLAALYKSLHNCEGVQPEAYVPADPIKWKMLDLTPPQFPALKKQELDDFTSVLEKAGVKMIL